MSNIAASDNTYVTYPWDTTGGTFGTEPEQPAWKQPYTQQWPPPPLPEHPAELEGFEEFVIWACGFTDPENPPSQAKWEEFQKKVQQLAADFVEFKRMKRERERMYTPTFTTSTSNISTEEINKLKGMLETGVATTVTTI